MRNIVILVVAMLGLKAVAASAYWTGIYPQNNEGLNDTKEYSLGADIYGENGAHTWINTSLYGHMANGNFYLKQMDFSGEWMNPTFNWWAIVVYGEIVDETTFHDATKQVELFWGDEHHTGGTLVEKLDDFYMAFKASEVLLEGGDYVEGQSWYGWVHVSVDDTDLKMTLLGSGINLYGGAVTVGAIPEPHSALLLLLGGALLALRRRRR